MKQVAEWKMVLVEVEIGPLTAADQPGGVSVLVLVNREEARLSEPVDDMECPAREGTENDQVQRFGPARIAPRRLHHRGH